VKRSQEKSAIKFQDKSATKLSDRNADKFPESNVNKYHVKSAEMFPDKCLVKSVTKFQEKNVNRFQGRSVSRFQGRCAIKYQERTAGTFQDRYVSKSHRLTVSKSQGSSVHQYVSLHIIVKFARMMNMVLLRLLFKKSTEHHQPLFMVIIKLNPKKNNFRVNFLEPSLFYVAIFHSIESNDQKNKKINPVGRSYIIICSTIFIGIFM